MTTYGVGRTGVAFGGTSYSPTLGTVPGTGNAYAGTTTSGFAYFNGYTQQDRRVNTTMRRGWGIKLQALFQALVGSVGGGGVIQNRLWVGGSPLNPPSGNQPIDNYGSGAQGGGLVRIENAAPPPMNRVAGANDIGDLKTLVSFTGILGPAASADVSGNGYSGAGKAGW